jgi:peptide deformylase
MAVRPIRLFGDPVLRAGAPIDVIDDGIRALVQDLLDTVELPGRGVAARRSGSGCARSATTSTATSATC